MQYIREKIHLLHKRQASGKVENSTGFLLEALRQNYANPDYALEIKSKAVAAAGYARRERESKARGLETQKSDLERSRDRELQALARRIAEGAPEVLEAALPDLADNFMVRQYYKSSQSALENFRERSLLEMVFYPYLERHSPEQFQSIRQDYAARIAAVDERIAAVG